MASMLVAGPAVATPSGHDIFLHGTSGGAAPCAACHGIDGQGRGIGAPKLAGMKADAVVASLARLAGGNGVMALVASRLTDDERRSVAGYIETLGGN